MARAHTALVALLLGAISCGSPAKEPPPRTFKEMINEHSREDARVDSFTARADAARVLGDSSAKVWIVGVVDFQCADCRRWYNEVLPTLQAGPIKAGQLRVALLQLPMPAHLNAMTSAVAAVCAASEGKYWDVISRIFATQEQWKDLPDARPYLDSVAIGAGVDSASHRICTERARGMKLVQTDAERSRTAGVTEVPTFFVGAHRVVGYTTAAGFRAIVDSAIAGR